MHVLNISWADIAVVVVLAVSTILAVARGFVRETLSILAWAAAAISTARLAAAATLSTKPTRCSSGSACMTKRCVL